VEEKAGGGDKANSRKMDLESDEVGRDMLERRTPGRDKRVEAILIERYKKYFMSENSFKRGLGVPWPALRSAIISEAMRCHSEVAGTLPLTLQQAAAVLSVPPRALLALSKKHAGENAIFASLSGSRGLVRRGVVCPCRLLQWASEVDAVSGWRERRSEVASIGATAKAAEIVDQIGLLESTLVEARMVDVSRGDPKVISLRLDERALPMNMDDIRMWQQQEERALLESRDRGVRAVSIPEALSLRWQDEGLRRVWLDRFRVTLVRLEALLNYHRSDLRQVAIQTKAQLRTVEHGRRRLRLVISSVR
jgi:hypothetical protein